MTRALREQFSALPTAAKLLLILSAVLLPIGLALVALAQNGIRDANAALQATHEDRARNAARSIESLVARNAMALRIAANGRVTGNPESCALARNSLSITPAVAQRFEIDRPDGTPVCSVGEIHETADLPAVAPGDIHLEVAPDGQAMMIRAGVVGGMITGELTMDELRAAVRESQAGIESIAVADGRRSMTILQRSAEQAGDSTVSRWGIANGQLTATVTGRVARIATVDRLLLLLPLLMWVTAALLTWILVGRLLIRPLKQVQRAVITYQPGAKGLDLPRRMGPATEIQELADAFRRAVMRVEASEDEMAAALDGQRRLVREVHHRVKNNLQVVASLLNIHGRSADSPSARAAYAAIARRVGALSIVHRNHFAEMEENRGIALRPLISELAAELRASVPDSSRGLRVELDLDSVNTTQDVAVAVAFLVTEIIEFAMLNRPQDPVEIALRRTSELTARLDINSPVLNPDEADQPEKTQFERIVTGLARQLRSPLDRKLGRYSVDLPVFPAY